MRQSMMLIGLTGGIASGKSLVASFFRKRQIPVIDADRIAREVVKPGRPAYREIVAVFGPVILKRDKAINRMRLGEVVFSNEPKRRLLETITHPEILKRINIEIRNLQKRGHKWAVVDAALLFESGLYKKMDKNLLVVCNPMVQLQRLMKRDKLPEPAAWARILSQLPTTEKQKLADCVVDNSGTPATTRKQVETLLKTLG